VAEHVHGAERPLSRYGRGILLVALCALVYYVSFDHGRESQRRSQRPQVEEQERRFQELALELRLIKAQLDACQAAPTEGGPTSLGRIALKANQSRTIFDGRLILSLLALDSETSRALLQFNFVREDHQTSEELAVGGSYTFSLGGRSWAVVLSGLTLTTANLTLMEIKSDP